MKQKKPTRGNIKELIQYGFAGVVTTILNLALYHMGIYLGISYKKADLIALIASKVFAYLANKKVVFKSKCTCRGDLLKEIVTYIISRGITGLIDYFGLICMVELFSADKLFAKYFLQVIVIGVNYFLGKYVVFKQH